MADAVATATHWYHKGWPAFLLGILVGGVFLAAPVGLGVRWIFRKVKATISAVTPAKAA
jgi:hypothetical protein